MHKKSIQPVADGDNWHTVIALHQFDIRQSRSRGNTASYLSAQDSAPVYRTCLLLVFLTVFLRQCGNTYKVWWDFYDHCVATFLLSVPVTASWSVCINKNMVAWFLCDSQCICSKLCFILGAEQEEVRTKRRTNIRRATDKAALH